MIVRLLKELSRQWKALAPEMFILGIAFIAALGTLGWNLTLVQQVFAEPDSELTAVSLTRQISSLKQSAYSGADTTPQSGAIQDRIQRLPSKHGVIIKSLRRWEHTQKRKSTAMVSLELESSYQACVAALREIEQWREISVTEISVVTSDDNERFVVLSITFADKSLAS